MAAGGRRIRGAVCRWQWAAWRGCCGSRPRARSSRAPRAHRCWRRCCAAAPAAPPPRRSRRRATSCCTRPASACGSSPSTRLPCRPWRAPTSCPALSTWPATPPRKRWCSVDPRLQDIQLVCLPVPHRSLSCPRCGLVAEMLQDVRLLCDSCASTVLSCRHAVYGWQRCWLMMLGRSCVRAGRACGSVGAAKSTGSPWPGVGTGDGGGRSAQGCPAAPRAGSHQISSKGSCLEHPRSPLQAC